MTMVETMGSMNLNGAVKRLRHFAKNRQEAPPLRKCELCSEIIDRKHRHLFEPQTRKCLCVCPPCSLVFDETGVTKYKKVPLEVRRLSELHVNHDNWEKLLIPINLAFLFKSSAAGRVIALYPSPAGLTESSLDLTHWTSLEAANPAVAQMKADVEALLVNQLKGKKDYFIAPIDRCFELVGLVRKFWTGFSGGDLVHGELESYFSKLRQEASP